MREVPGSNPGRALLFVPSVGCGIKKSAVTRIRTWVVAATTRSTNHYTITADGIRGPNVNLHSLANFAEKHKNSSPAGNRTPVFRVTGGDTHHYTTEEHVRYHQVEFVRSFYRLRPYHVECTGSRLITEVKQRWARLVLAWVTGWEYHVPKPFVFSRRSQFWSRKL